MHRNLPSSQFTVDFPLSKTDCLTINQIVFFFFQESCYLLYGSAVYLAVYLAPTCVQQCNIKTFSIISAFCAQRLSSSTSCAILILFPILLSSFCWESRACRREMVACCRKQETPLQCSMWNAGKEVTGCGVGGRKIECIDWMWMEILQVAM